MRLTPPRASGLAETALKISRNLPEMERRWKLRDCVTKLRYPHVHDTLYRQNVAPENAVRTSPVPSDDRQ
jgi:hypothetical protein